MKTVYRDSTTAWVPFATVGVIVAAVWGSLVWQEFNLGFATLFALGLAVLLLIGVVLQGVLYWKTDIAELATDGATVEARVARWVGRGRRLRFPANEATGWRSIAKSGDETALSAIAFTLGGTEYNFSAITASLLDLEGLRPLAPVFFERLRADFPALATGTKSPA